MLMTPQHPQWEDFVVHLVIQLGGTEGYWKCGGGTDKSKATRILKAISDIDIDGSLRYFERCGAYCDCEILLNIEA